MFEFKVCDDTDHSGMLEITLTVDSEFEYFIIFNASEEVPYHNQSVMFHGDDMPDFIHTDLLRY